MTKKLLPWSLVAAGATFALAGAGQAQNLPNLSGTYRCVPEPAACRWQGKPVTISQNGPAITITVDKAEFAAGKLTSNISISAGPPFNAEGRILPDRSIEWSNGTRWTKQ
jgi:hypothetical protein